MTMMITKFNKLIANKVVWIGFTFLIVVAFAFMGLSGSGNDEARQHQSVGTLFGETVSAEEFHTARRLAYMGLILAMNDQIEEDELRDITWRRLASLKRAEELGIQASDREIVDAIRSFPDFGHQGQFNPQIYSSFVNQYLPAMGFSPAEFEHFVRQELAIQKLQRMITESVLLSPHEVDRAVSTFGDEFTVQYTLITRSDLGEGLEVTEEDARSYFEENQEAFRIPPHITVRYVRFLLDDFKDRVEVTEEEALDYYDRNMDDFVVAEEREDDEEADLEEDDIFAVTLTQPFEEVRDIIFDRLKRERAANAAAHAATDFVISLVPDRAGNAPSFDEAAAELGLTIEITEEFNRSQIPEGIDAGFSFTRAAFNLHPHPEHYFSDAILGIDAVYVLALGDEIPSRLPEFEEVQDEATAAALADLEDRALEELAASFRDLLIETLAEGDAFADAAEVFLLSVADPVTFTAAQGPEDLRYGNELLRTVLQHNAGEVPEPIFVRNGYLVAHVQARTAADPFLFDEFRPRIMGALTGERGALLFRDWQDQLLREANFTPRQLDRSGRDDDWNDDEVER